MKRIPIADNSSKKISDLNLDASDIENLRKIANVPIAQISLDENPNLLVFPREWNHYGDEIDKSCILSMSEQEISTGNIMGFVGVNDTQLDITSRFSKVQDYFLHYMLQKVFSINLFDIQHSISKQPIFDFLLYLFPHFLKKALAQGLFKKYKRYEYNDANLRGPIDVNRHIRQNIPFRGTVAYSTREHSYDNEVTQLIRHTIEYIRAKEQGAAILNNDAEMKACVSQIVTATQSYNVRDRNKVIGQNLRPVRHPYYSAYTALQKICLQILRHESIKYGQEKDKVYGILFDGAWLWEEYLNTILKGLGFNHPENKKHKGGFQMFDNKTNKEADIETIDRNSRRLYPDFYKDDFILDAKYKRLNNGVGREDLYQVVTYMYCQKAINGGYLFPCEKEEKSNKYKLNGYEGTIHLLPFLIPKSSNSYQSFVGIMKEKETDICNTIKGIH